MRTTMTISLPKAVLIGLTLVSIAGLSAPFVDAHSGAKGVVKERMELMKGMADAMKAMGGMFKGEAPFEPAVVADKASWLIEHAEKIPATTPEGSNDHPSEALPIIWEAWDGYLAGTTALKDESAKLKAIATNGADEAVTRAQYVKVSKSCSACHDKYRKPKE